LSVETAREWSAAYHRPYAVRYRVRWTLAIDQGSSVRGRAAIVVVPPDSVRFDYRAPFGRSGAAVVVGDRIVWSRPPEEVARLIQVAPVFWAALGLPREPWRGATVTGAEEAKRRTWRYAAGADTLTYLGRHGSRSILAAEYRRAGRVVGSVEVEFAAGDGRPVAARMRFPEGHSQVLFTVEAVDSLGQVDPEIWRAP
jgi:hypothetical protein